MYNHPGVLDYCESLYAKSIRSPLLLGFMIDCFEEMLEDEAAKDVNKAQILKRALEVRALCAWRLLPLARVQYGVFCPLRHRALRIVHVIGFIS